MGSFTSPSGHWLSRSTFIITPSRSMSPVTSLPVSKLPCVPPEEQVTCQQNTEDETPLSLCHSVQSCAQQEPINNPHHQCDVQVGKINYVLSLSRRRSTTPLPPNPVLLLFPWTNVANLLLSLWVQTKIVPNPLWQQILLVCNEEEVTKVLFRSK